LYDRANAILPLCLQNNKHIVKQTHCTWSKKKSPKI